MFGLCRSVAEAGRVGQLGKISRVGLDRVQPTATTGGNARFKAHRLSTLLLSVFTSTRRLRRLAKVEAWPTRFPSGLRQPRGLTAN